MEFVDFKSITLEHSSTLHLSLSISKLPYSVLAIIGDDSGSALITAKPALFS